MSLSQSTDQCATPCPAGQERTPGSRACVRCHSAIVPSCSEPDHPLFFLPATNLRLQQTRSPIWRQVVSSFALRFVLRSLDLLMFGYSVARCPNDSTRVPGSEKCVRLGPLYGAEHS